MRRPLGLVVAVAALWAGAPTAHAGLPAPETEITSGPAGETWTAAPSFEFTSTLPGSTFSCRFDGGAWVACESGYYAALESGPHTFEVFATSSDWISDESPASRGFTVRPRESQQHFCQVIGPTGVPAFPQVGDRFGCFPVFRGPWDCSGRHPENRCYPSGCPFGFGCTERLIQCPAGAKCSVATKVTWRDRDDGKAGAFAVSEFVARNLNPPRRYRRSVQGDARACTTNGSRCTTTARTTRIGAGEWARSRCAISGFAPERRGPEHARRVQCRMEVTVGPAQPIDPIAFRTTVQLYAPASGRLILEAIGGAPRVARDSLSRKPVFTPVRRRVDAAGRVAVKPRLSRKAKRVLRRKGKLAIRFKATFRADSGQASTKRARVKLTKPKRRRSR